jgi:hypothetical protein
MFCGGCLDDVAVFFSFLVGDNLPYLISLYFFTKLLHLTSGSEYQNTWDAIDG